MTSLRRGRRDALRSAAQAQAYGDLAAAPKPMVLPGSFTRSGSLRALGIRPKAHTHWHSVMWHDMHAHASSHARAYHTHPDVHTHTLARTSVEEHTRISHAQRHDTQSYTGTLFRRHTHAHITCTLA